MNEKIIFGMFVIGVVALLQMVAWTLGFDGAVYAFTSLIIGAVAGSILGFSLRNPPLQPPTSSEKQG